MCSQPPQVFFRRSAKSAWDSRFNKRETALRRKSLPFWPAKLSRLLLTPSHMARLARVSATYSKRMSSSTLDSVISGSCASSSSASTASLASSLGGFLKLPKNGTNTKGYSSPLLLWKVTICTHWSSVSRRIFCASGLSLLDCSLSAKCCNNAAGPCKPWLAFCSSSPKCSRLVKRRSPSGKASKRVAMCCSCNQL